MDGGESRGSKSLWQRRLKRGSPAAVVHRRRVCAGHGILRSFLRPRNRHGVPRTLPVYRLFIALIDGVAPRGGQPLFHESMPRGRFTTLFKSPIKVFVGDALHVLPLVPLKMMRVQARAILSMFALHDILNYNVGLALVLASVEPSADGGLVFWKHKPAYSTCIRVLVERTPPLLKCGFAPGLAAETGNAAPRETHGRYEYPTRWACVVWGAVEVVIKIIRP